MVNSVVKRFTFSAHAEREKRETTSWRQLRLARTEQAKAFKQPGCKGARVYQWEQERGGHWIRHYVERGEVPVVWDPYVKSQKFYNSFTGEWDFYPGDDLCKHSR